MLKLLFKIIVIVLILFGLSYYANYLATGNTPEIGMNKSILPNIDISELKDSISEKFETIKDEEPVKNTYLYKWRDEKGVVHYTSEKPVGKIQDLESIKLSNDTNVVPAVSENKLVKERISSPKPPSTELPESIYSPEGIKHLFDQAKGVQNLMNDQFSQQENIINEN